MKKLYLEKRKRFDRLTKKDHEDLTMDLVNAMVSAKSIKDAALILQDLLTRSEMNILSKRLRIAKLLLAGMTYEEIKKQLFVSHGTIAKIAAWLAEKGDGFRKIIKDLPKKSNAKDIMELSDWDRIKRRHSLYFWPELLLEEIIKNANNRQKERIKDVLDQLDRKSELHKSINNLLRH